jgi:hypothetical protein
MLIHCNRISADLTRCMHTHTKHSEEVVQLYVLHVGTPTILDTEDTWDRKPKLAHLSRLAVISGSKASLLEEEVLPMLAR